MSHSRSAPRNKAEFRLRQLLGEFGNRIRVWREPATAMLHHSGPFGLRSVVPGGAFHPGVPRDKLMELWTPQHTVDEGFVDEHRIMNAEVCRDPDLRLFYSLERTDMRTGLRRSGQEARGLRARMLLEAYCWPSSLEDIRELLDAYPNAAIEFSLADRAVGVLPHRNHVVWEVREDY